MAAIRIATIGGVPPSLGGGGLETQAAETLSALQRRGHTAFHVAREPEPRPFDVLHAFGAEVDVCQHLVHWRRNPAPLVVSPILVVPPGRERRERLAARVPLASYGPRMRADALRRADLVIAQTDHEAGLLGRLGARRTVTLPNGVTPVAPGPLPDGLTPGYALLLGTVNSRKRQAETVAALGGTPIVIAGGLEGDAAARQAFEGAVAASGATWLGEVGDKPTVRALLRGARALVHLSRAEGQSLALLEALSEGTPIVVSRLPANVELASRYPGHVHLVTGPAEAAQTVRALGERPATEPDVPTWDDVAALLEPLYEELLT